MEFITITPELLIFLFCAAFTAGFVDTLAGGGGLIALPAIIISGIPPLFALGTNKLQGTMGTATATYMMLKTGRVKWKDVRFLMCSAFIGSFLGTIAVQFINTQALEGIIPIVLVLMAVYFLISPQPSRAERDPAASTGMTHNLVVPAIGWYDGMFGPGAGSFFALSGVSLRGMGLIEATAVAKTLNFSTNFASLAVFLAAGKVVWSAGAVMMLGQMAGAWGGSRFLFKINPRHLRLIVVLMCLGMLVRYLFS